MKIHLLLIIFSTFVFISQAQVNLVPNPSFEDYIDCPYGFDGFFGSESTFYIVDQWMRPSSGTSDLFNSCASVGSGMNVPDAFFGYRYAHTGEGYAGMYTVISGYREYIQTRLTDTLEAGKCYYIEYWVAPGFKVESGYYYNLTTDEFGLNISDERYFDEFDYGVIDIEANLENPEGYFLTDTVNWNKTGGFYTAEGGEEWIILGNFKDDGDTDPILIDSAYEDFAALSYGYFFVDDVMVTPADSAIYINDTSLCSLTYTILGPVGGDSYLWSTGDTTLNITVTETGFYWLDISTPCGILSDTAFINFVTVAEEYMSEEVEVCSTSFPYELSAPSGYSEWLWDSGETTESITVNEPGIYIVTSAVECGTLTDTIYVTTTSLPSLFIGNDSLICADQPWNILLSANNEFSSYEWNTGETTQSITITGAGIYSVNASTACGTVLDEIEFTSNPLEGIVVDLGNDIALCPNYSNNSVTFTAPDDLPTYFWNTGSTEQSITVSDPGTYWVTINNPLCNDIGDSVRVTVCNDLFLPNAFSPNNDGINDLLYLIGLLPENLISFTVYNRWGEIVFETN
ncbi:MAG: gliding motility-associated C-terminal domain-containing protein, partial [Fimbriimonadaceae bacterium]|nr:gliding motility-associated C-terminal domain-containing protein [Chitinophagales bacterium]